MPNAPQNGFRAFAVKDDLSLTPDGKQRPATTAAPKKTVKKIELPIAQVADADKAWQDYFAAEQPEPKALRDAVRQLWASKQYEQVIAAINAALRNGQAQPWMYEVMSLAMQVQGRPKEEIERVVMSAVDFVDTPSDLLYVGVHVNRLGLHRRALEIFKQVSELVPLAPQPYILGLAAAREVDDIEGRKWATLGILSQAWPNDQQHVWKTGIRVANATLERLRKEKRFEEAKQYEEALDLAVTRDCLVRVSWTGDADVDLLVEEPSGSICSLRNPRTNAGGVMLGDAYARFGQNNSGGYSEIYVCPKGFSGTYRLLLRRVWGKVTTGKVNVDVFTHYRGEGSRHIGKRISLSDDRAMVVFELDKGRRKESLDDQQVANATVNQMAIGRQILAQQLAAAVDPSAMQEFSLSQQLSSSGDSDGGFIPFIRSGAVGYRPVIIVLPEGTNMSATAVISADRRYVRVSCSPLFSGVSEVNTFNTVTGEGAEGRGGGGGGWSDVAGGGGGGGGGGDGDGGGGDFF